MRIAFIVVSFPAVSETFVLNQITGLIDLGHTVEIFAGSCPKGSLAKTPCAAREARQGRQRSQRKGETSNLQPPTLNIEREVRHTDIDRYHLMAHTRCHNYKPANWGHRILKAAWLMLAQGWRNPLAVLRSLNVFKYGREALSLNLFYKTILFLSAGKFDVIYCQFGSSGNVGAMLKELGISGKLMTMFHGSDIRRGIEKGAGIYRRLMDQGDCFLSISDFNYKHLVGFGVDPQKIVPHPVGIDLTRFPFRESDGIIKEGEPVRILTMARLSQEKGLEYGIRAVGRLLQKTIDKKTFNIERSTSNVQRYRVDTDDNTEQKADASVPSVVNSSPKDAFLRYQIIGDGPLEAELKTLVKDLGLGDIVEFLGAQDSDKVAESLQKSHLFLLPSIAEATPVSLMEAQAVGLPVVATRVGGVSEVVVDGKSGFLVPPGDMDALAEKLRYLIENPCLWSAMGRRGREHVEQHYDIAKLNKRLVEIFEGMVQGKTSNIEH